MAFPHGNLKALATVGEVSVCDDSIGEMIVGVPDGLGVYLSDDDTLRAVVQSESYGPLQFESYPFHVNGGAASFTGSHVQVSEIDIFVSNSQICISCSSIIFTHFNSFLHSMLIMTENFSKSSWRKTTQRVTW